MIIIIRCQNNAQKTTTIGQIELNQSETPSIYINSSIKVFKRQGKSSIATIVPEYFSPKLQFNDEQNDNNSGQTTSSELERNRCKSLSKFDSKLYSDSMDKILLTKRLKTSYLFKILLWFDWVSDIINYVKS